MNTPPSDRELANEAEILELALRSLKRETGLTSGIKEKEAHIEQRQLDAVIDICAAETHYNYLVEVKNRLTPSVISELVRTSSKRAENMLIVSRQISMEMGKLLQSLNLQYLDTLGNAYLRQDLLHIHISGFTQSMKLSVKDANARYGTGGIRVIFVLLLQENTHLPTYREIAELSGTSLGTVANCISKLIRKGFMLDFGVEGRKLVRKSRLIDEWVSAYISEFRSKTLTGRFSTELGEVMHNADLSRHGAMWGGETAAAKLTNYLKPGLDTIYYKNNSNTLQLALKLRQQDNGVIELRKRFWNFESDSIQDVTPPLLIYADILATDAARNIETARLIYDRYIHGHIDQG